MNMKQCCQFTHSPMSSSVMSAGRLIVDDGYQVCPQGCRSWFCPKCGVRNGFRLRERLLAVQGRFRRPMMLTFTVDPKLFATPGLALQYVQDRRCIAETMRSLRVAGCIGQHWFAVVEWQEQTEMPHWHVLVDAGFVPFDKLCAAWNRHRPESAGEADAVRPGFGSVKFSQSGGTATRAIYYVTKYLTKHPDGGYPAWVMESARRIRRFSTSRGFWGGGAGDRDGEGDSDEIMIDRPAAVLTPEQRVAGCGSRLVVYRVVDECDTRTGEIVSRYRFECVAERPSGIIGMEVLEDDWLFRNRIDLRLLRLVLSDAPLRHTG